MFQRDGMYVATKGHRYTGIPAHIAELHHVGYAHLISHVWKNKKTSKGCYSTINKLKWQIYSGQVTTEDFQKMKTLLRRYFSNTLIQTWDTIMVDWLTVLPSIFKDTPPPMLSKGFGRTLSIVKTYLNA